VEAAFTDNALAASLSAVTGAIVSYIVAKYQTRAAFRGTVDASLIRKRERLYRQLWRMTSVLPRWPSSHACTYTDITHLDGVLKDWYFDGGGLYLSEQARSAYGVLRASMDALPERLGVLSDVDYERLFQAATKLRTELTKDLFSRERPVA
jgi:hypothetical protein